MPHRVSNAVAASGDESFCAATTTDHRVGGNHDDEALLIVSSGTIGHARSNRGNLKAALGLLCEVNLRGNAVGSQFINWGTAKLTANPNHEESDTPAIERTQSTSKNSVQSCGVARVGSPPIRTLSRDT